MIFLYNPENGKKRKILLLKICVFSLLGFSLGFVIAYFMKKNFLFTKKLVDKSYSFEERISKPENLFLILKKLNLKLIPHILIFTSSITIYLILGKLNKTNLIAIKKEKEKHELLRNSYLEYQEYINNNEEMLKSLSESVYLKILETIFVNISLCFPSNVPDLVDSLGNFTIIFSPFPNIQYFFRQVRELQLQAANFNHNFQRLNRISSALINDIVRDLLIALRY